jgi:hypothetical protein
MTNRQIAAQVLLNVSEDDSLKITNAIKTEVIKWGLHDIDIEEIFYHIDDMLIEQMKDSYVEQ